MTEASRQSFADLRDGAGCLHSPICSRCFFQFNGRWICVACDVTRSGEHDPDAPKPTQGH